ncbi:MULTISPECIES: hypothetical protein [unclassified Brevibacterium]|uniref:hypothetical protein n=1 Tax=unclassified Brevibacterium TaxID=2614124 RepID=UPI0008A2AF05|nr:MULTISPECIES: hypothetical protein [unclassified Brevibacterium]OFL68797.1 hypothetical protein HMPREF2757_07790 [Brevibacterium sp. HMSC063G07]OFS25562.1 hypothetical protein HMPREF3162_08270 [Brevibacterium sp. HMSC07C04]
MTDHRVLLPENVWSFDGTIESAAAAIKRAGANLPLFILDASDRSGELLIGQARAARADSELIAVSSGLGPLGRACLADFARQLAPAHDPGLIVAVLREIERAARNFVITGKPGGLKRPNPNIWQHLAGILPSRTAIAELNGSVKTFGRKGIPSSAAGGFALHNMALHSTVPQDEAGACRTLLDEFCRIAAPAQYAAHPQLTEAQSEWWGPHDAVEIVAVPADISPVIAAVKQKARTCPWCQLSTLSDVCSYCSAPGTAAHPIPRSTLKGQFA